MNDTDREWAKQLEWSIFERDVREMYELENLSTESFCGGTFLFHANYTIGFEGLAIPQGNVLIEGHGLVMSVG